MENVIVTRKDQDDAVQARIIGIGLAEYKNARAILHISNRSVSSEEIYNMAQRLRSICIFRN